LLRSLFDVGLILSYAEIINPALDPNKPAATEMKIIEKLSNYVDSQVFTVSTIFCLFEKVTMMDTFKLLDPQRQPVVGSSLTDLRNHVTEYFGESTEQWLANKGTPFATPENPYILGYGISQKRATIGDIGGPGVDTAATPDCFKPRQVGAMTVTPGDVRTDWVCTSGSLNYCLLTHRDSDEGHERIEIEESDLNAGVLTKNFFDITKTMGRTEDPQGNKQGHDGIMGFSKGIFSELWLQSVARKLLIDPDNSTDYKAMIAKGLQKESKEVTISLGNMTGPTAIGNGWELKRTWRTDWLNPPKSQLKFNGEHRMCILGTSIFSSP
jgi:hypothetical protein